MAGKRTGGDIPQGLIRDVARRRTIWGALDARRTGEADIRPTKFVRPRGKGIAIVEQMSGGQEQTVANPFGRTFRPGTTVPTGSFSGSGQEFILSGPPAGKKGARRAAPVRRPYGTIAAAPADQYAFFSVEAGTAVLAALYTGGLYRSDRGTLASTLYVYGVIFSDEQELVGAGAAILASSLPASSIAVLDFENEVSYSYSVPSGWVGSIPGYADGYLWWVEAQDPSGHATAALDARLRRANCDLTDVQTIGSTFTTPALPVPFTHFHGGLVELYGAVITGTGVMAYLRPAAFDAFEATPDPYPVHRLHWTFGGTLTSDSTQNSSSSAPFGYGLVPVLGGASVLSAASSGVDPTPLYSQPDDASSVPSELWVSTIYDDPLGPPVSLMASFNVSPAGTVAQVYSQGFIGRASATGSATVWATKAAVAPHPDLEAVPDQMFYFGGD